MSPVGETLRTRCRNFPGLVNNTVIDWFEPWPEQALHSVATVFLQASSPICHCLQPHAIFALLKHLRPSMAVHTYTYEPALALGTTQLRFVHIVCCQAPLQASEHSCNAQKTRQLPHLLLVMGNYVRDMCLVTQEEALDAEVRSSIVSHMVLVHQSVRTFSTKFLEQLRRHNYVTPKNYLEFIHNYKHALADNRTTFSGMASRLDGGLQKLIQVL